MMVICVALLTVKHGAVGDTGHGAAVMLVPPTDTTVAPENNVPVTITVLPPATTRATRRDSGHSGDRFVCVLVRRL